MNPSGDATIIGRARLLIASILLQGMSVSTSSDPAATELSEYDQNRQQFTPEQLEPYEGQWVAFSLDGKHIVAAASDLLALDKRLQELGTSMEAVWLEMMTSEPVRLGACG
jgi:hypothetical protein